MKTAYDIIDTILVSEKNTDLEDLKKYVFRVAKTASKIEVRHAVEKLFPDVKVTAVNMMNYKGKPKRSGRSPKQGKRADWKKAVVTLDADSSIDVL